MYRPKFVHKSGIYIIICTASLKMYIGSSEELAARFSEHRSELRRGVHPNLHLQRAWNKYGEDKFVFGILEYCKNEEDLFPREQYYLDTYRPYDKNLGYNIAPTVEGSRGLTVSAEVRKRIGDANRGRIKSPETVQKLKNAWIENGEEYQKQAIEQRGISFQIVSPDGILHTVKGLKRFAREHGLDPAQLARVIKRQQNNQSVKGWHLPDTPFPEPYRIRSPEGIIHVISFGSLTKFAKSNYLDACALGRMARGVTGPYRGWTRVDLSLEKVV